jgi:RNA polymerase sigma-70 factor (ECF subfamily)
MLSEPVLVYLTRRTYDPEVALELTAETFARAFADRKRFRGNADAEAEAWIYAIARHLLARWYRRGQVERRALARLGMQVPRLEADEYERIEELAELPAMRTELAAALQALSHDQREALRLRVIDELSYEQIARRLGVPEPTVRARVSRGLRGLAAALEGGPA